MEIKRDIYLNKLISKKHNRLIKVITGIRRCGKSYLLFNLFRDHLAEEHVADDHIIEMAFDSYENKKYRDPDVFFPMPICSNDLIGSIREGYKVRVQPAN